MTEEFSDNFGDGYEKLGFGSAVIISASRDKIRKEGIIYRNKKNGIFLINFKKGYGLYIVDRKSVKITDKLNKKEAENE